jgi:hypothetical protein
LGADLMRIYSPASLQASVKSLISADAEDGSFIEIILNYFNKYGNFSKC